MDKVLRSKIPYKEPRTENLIEYIRDGLKKNAKLHIVVDSVTGQSWTGEDLERAILYISDQLTNNYGLKKGQAVCIYDKETDKTALLILALICCGAVPLMLNQDYAGEEVRGTIDITKARMLFTTAERIRKIKTSVEKVQNALLVFMVDEEVTGLKFPCTLMRGLYPNSVQPIPQTQMTFEKLLELVPINPEIDLANIQFSSGTTGKPKVIPRTHKNYAHLVACVDHEELMNLGPNDAIAGSVQLTHRPGMWCLLTCVKNGTKMVVGSNLGDVELNLSLMEKHNLTVFTTSLPLLGRLGTVGLGMKKKYNIRHLKQIVTSGAKIVNFDLPKKIVDEFELDSLRQAFGMTESGWIFLVESSLAKDNFLTVGHVVPGTDAVILDRVTGQRVGPNVKGELAVRGPQIFPGYLTDTPGLYNRADFTEDGWFRTGDQAYYDENEFIFIEGRYKELMVFSNNFRYFPNDIEAIINEHPAIAGSCVVKVGEIRTHQAYDVARAYVILRQDYQASEADIVEFVKARCTMIMLDGGVRFIDDFPRLHNGKVDKTMLKSIP